MTLQLGGGLIGVQNEMLVGAPILRLACLSESRLRVCLGNVYLFRFRRAPYGSASATGNRRIYDVNLATYLGRLRMWSMWKHSEGECETVYFMGTESLRVH